VVCAIVHLVAYFKDRLEHFFEAQTHLDVVAGCCIFVCVRNGERFIACCHLGFAFEHICMHGTCFDFGDDLRAFGNPSFKLLLIDHALDAFGRRLEAQHLQHVLFGL